MRDFLPADIRKRNYVINIIKEVYESYGFEPLETPSVENLETLTGKYGEEGNQLMYKILKRGEKLNVNDKELADLALRYDLTVPLARVVANYKNDLPKFFKRYQIQPVWRADRPARGRYREFYQCDVDAIGSKSMIVEAELISAVCEILQRLGFEDFTIRVNHREILQSILEVAEVPIANHSAALVALDKIDKIGRDGVAREFKEKGISNESEIKLLAFFDYFIKDESSEIFKETGKKNFINLVKKYNLELKDFSQSQEILSKLKNIAPKIDVKGSEEEKIYKLIIGYLIKSFDEFEEKEKEIKHFFDNNCVSDVSLIKKFFSEIENLEAGLMLIIKPLLSILQFVQTSEMGLKGVLRLIELIKLLYSTSKNSFILIDPTLARGLSYYTGAIFEINVPDLAGSLGGGGRYDGLIGIFGKEQIPAVGFSLGLERILLIMDERGMFPEEIQQNSADVMVTIWNEESIGESLKLAGDLRSQGLRVLVYPEADKLGKQFKYADSLGIQTAIILRDEEIAENKVKIKNLITSDEIVVRREEVLEKIK